MINVNLDTDNFKKIFTEIISSIEQGESTSSSLYKAATLPAVTDRIPGKIYFQIESTETI